MAVAEGSAKNRDIGGIGAVAGSAGVGIGVGYSKTAEGKVIVAAFMDSYSGIASAVRNYRAQCVGGGLGTGGQLQVQVQSAQASQPAVQPLSSGTTTSRSMSSVATAPQMTLAQAQEKLNELGFAVGRPDGVMGPRTCAQFRAFQKSQSVEGVIFTDLVRPQIRYIPCGWYMPGASSPAMRFKLAVPVVTRTAASALGRRSCVSRAVELGDAARLAGDSPDGRRPAAAAPGGGTPCSRRSVNVSANLAAPSQRAFSAPDIQRTRVHNRRSPWGFATWLPGSSARARDQVRAPCPDRAGARQSFPRAPTPPPSSPTPAVPARG